MPTKRSNSGTSLGRSNRPLSRTASGARVKVRVTPGTCCRTFDENRSANAVNAVRYAGGGLPEYSKSSVMSLRFRERIWLRASEMRFCCAFGLLRNALISALLSMASVSPKRSPSI